jgi:signal peptidase I
VLLVLLLLILLVTQVIFIPRLVVGDSMSPNLMDGDRLLITRGYDDPRAGDVVVADLTDVGGRGTAVKRVAGVPGDAIAVRGDSVFVNGSEPPSPEVTEGGHTAVEADLVVPDGYVFLLGDNRPVSLDSRFVGPVALDKIIGRAVIVFSPVTRLGLVDDGHRGD